MLFALPLTAATASLAAPAATGITWLSQSFVDKIEDALLLGLGALGSYLFNRFTKRAEQKETKRRKMSDLQYLSAKTIELNRYAQFMLDTTGCDHVSVYAAANGQYLKSGDSIEKFIMQAEAAAPGEPRYMDVEPLIYANQLPHLISKIFIAEYVLLWPNQCDDEKCNKLMRQRGYSSSIAMLVTVPAPHGRFVLGMVVLNWKQLILHPIKSQLPEKHSPFETYVTLEMQQAITKFKLESSDLLDNKRE